MKQLLIHCGGILASRPKLLILQRHTVLLYEDVANLQIRVRDASLHAQSLSLKLLKVITL